MESGVLSTVTASWESKMLAPNSDKEWPNPSYTYVLLGACAMTLGCKLPEAYKTALREKFRDAHLMRDAMKQMDVALNDPEYGCKDGVPCDFGCHMTLEAFMDAGGPPKPDLLYPNSRMINCCAPFSMEPLSEASLLQIRRNILNKSFGSRNVEHVFAKVHSFYLPDELHTVLELKDNVLFNTYASVTTLGVLTRSDGAILERYRTSTIRLVPVMPEDYMLELKAKL